MRSSESLSSATRRPCAPSCEGSGRVGEDVPERRGEPLRVAVRGESARPALLHELADAPRLGRDDRDSGGHRLDHGERTALVVAREQRALGLGEERGHVFPVAEEPHTRRRPRAVPRAARRRRAAARRRPRAARPPGSRRGQPPARATRGPAALAEPADRPSGSSRGPERAAARSARARRRSGSRGTAPSAPPRPRGPPRARLRRARRSPRTSARRAARASGRAAPPRRPPPRTTSRAA